MVPHVSSTRVQPRRLAVVRRRVPISGIVTVWKPALDQIWAFLRTQPGLRTNGHNVFLYHHPANRDDLVDIDFGVEVVRSFTPSGEVHEASTPAGEAAIAVHRGPYDRLRTAHDAIRQWAAANQRAIGVYSWEIYGDPTPDPMETETTVVYLLE